MYTVREHSLYSGCVCQVCSSSPWHLAVNLFPEDNFEQDLPQSDRMQDLICHIQNDSFFTSSSRKRGEKKRVGKLFCTSQQTLFFKVRAATAQYTVAHRGTRQMLLGNSTPLMGNAQHQKWTELESETVARRDAFSHLSLLELTRLVPWSLSVVPANAVLSGG